MDSTIATLLENICAESFGIDLFESAFSHTNDRKDMMHSDKKKFVLESGFQNLVLRKRVKNVKELSVHYN